MGNEDLLNSCAVQPWGPKAGLQPGAGCVGSINPGYLSLQDRLEGRGAVIHFTEEKLRHREDFPSVHSQEGAEQESRIQASLTPETTS